jgi:D-alanine-D-alanine ligase
MNNMNITVLLGGISAERNVSFATGKAVALALAARGHTVTALDPAFGAGGGVVELSALAADAGKEPSAEELRAFSPERLIECAQSAYCREADCVFLALHGKYGEDGYMQALLDMVGARYTGSKTLSSAVAMSKATSKRIFQSAGILTPPFLTLSAATIRENGADFDLVDELRAEFGGGIVVKPDAEGSTFGVTISPDGDADTVKKGLEEAAKFCEVILVERFIPGRELTVGILGDEALPIVEIHTDTGFYDYAHKYVKGRTDYDCPADLPPDVEDFVLQLALSAHDALACRAYSRVDFRLDEDYQAFCLEVNTLPGMTETSLLPKAAAAVGIEFGELCERIIEYS